MAPPRKDTEQITFRLPTAWLSEADALAKKLSHAGWEASRTDVLRMAIAKGFETLRTETSKAKSK